MPNWCNNSVTITHTDPVKLEALAQAVREGVFCNHVIPVPPSLNIVSGRCGADDNPEQIALEAAQKSNMETHGHKDWYDFCVNKWGTKWDISPYQDDVGVEVGVLRFGFDSAWSPPIGVYEALVEQGFEVRGMYYEPGMGYVGDWHNGEDECIEYHDATSDTVRDMIGAELDDEFGISESMAEWEEENLEIDLDGGLSATNE